MKELTWRERGQLWLRLGLRLLLTAIGLWAAVRLGPPLVSLFAPFLLALGMAWLLAPAVKWLHGKLRVNRKVLSLLLLILVFAGLATLLWALGSAGVGELLSLAGSWEELLSSLESVINTIGALFYRIMDQLPLAVRQPMDGLVDQVFRWLETAIPQLISRAVDWATDMVKGLPSFAVATVVFLMASYFLTADYPHLRAQVVDRLPEGPRYVLSMVKRAFSVGFGGYVRAEVILSVGVFFILLGGFMLIHQPYALLLAFALAVLDFIPILGSGTVMVPWAVVDVITGDYRHAVGLLAVWGVVALFRRLAEPKVLGNQTGLSPILSLISVYVGMKVADVAGMVLGPVVCLVFLNMVRAGVLDRTMADVRLAVRDISAILKGGAGGAAEEEKS